MLLVIVSISKAQTKDIAYYINHAPFKMDPIKVPAFSDKTFSIVTYGAVNDGKTLCTEAFAKAIHACSIAGGGKVIVPAGIWLTGPIELESNVNLYTMKGALVQFTKDHTQYPLIKQPGSKTYTVKSPIYGANLENIAITGEGVFDGAGESWRPVKKSKVTPALWNNFTETGVITTDGKIWWPSVDAMNGEAYLNDLKSKPEATAEDYAKTRDFQRPYMFFLYHCKNILIDSIGLKNSPKFVFYPNRCNDLTISNIIVYNEDWAQNGDGIDISACKNVIIYNSMVNAGDDGICMKSSGGKDSLQSELENVIIAKCNVLRAHGGFVIGSNTDGGMHNIYVTDCVFNGSDIGLRIKSNIGRGGNVHDIYIDNIKMDNIVNEAILFSTSYDDKAVGKTSTENPITKADKVPHYHDFHISNIVCSKAATAMSIAGLPEQATHHLYFEKIQITAAKGFIGIDASDIDMKDVVLNVPAPIFTLTRCKNILLDTHPIE